MKNSIFVTFLEKVVAAVRKFFTAFKDLPNRW
jgi:hypothetical protein